MASVNDWAAKAADCIVDEIPGNVRNVPRRERIAAIIATFTEPMTALLRESKRRHAYEGETHCCQALRYSGEPCTCGAAEWNARVDKALEG